MWYIEMVFWNKRFKPNFQFRTLAESSSSLLKNNIIFQILKQQWTFMCVCVSVEVSSMVLTPPCYFGVLKFFIK